MPASLLIQAPQPSSQIALIQDDEQQPSPLSEESRPVSRAGSMRNAKQLAISIPSPPPSLDQPTPPPPYSARPRRPSVVSLPAVSLTDSLLHRKDEDGGGDAVPYSNGPVQIIPGIWIGSEDNARDWKGLLERGIRSILNVAKEVSSPFDAAARSLRPVSSTPNFRKSSEDSTYYPPHLPSGRPAMHYLKLQWSHGQQDLVNNGFQAAMSFVDQSLTRSEGVLVHCQCGISRSATMVIALVMRAAAEKSPRVPPEVWDLKGMQGAYSYVKDKSPCVGPNMSLIYQLLDYEKTLRGDVGSDSDDSSRDEEEWSRRRRELEDAPSPDDDDLEQSVIMQEARALDKAMEDRIIARKSSASSINSVGSGLGMGPAWKSRYGSRKRAGSIASNKTNTSILSEDLVEEDEEEALLGIGGGFDSARERQDSQSSASPDDDDAEERPTFYAPLTAKATTTRVPSPPPSAPVWKTAFQSLPPPLTAVRSTFDLPKPKRRRPLSLSVLPPVPSSPIVIEQDTDPKPVPPRRRTESAKPLPPPLHLRNTLLRRASTNQEVANPLHTPSQTLFVFPPSPTLTTRTPSAMTLEAVTGSVPFPVVTTPRISTFRQKGGRTRSFIGLTSPPTPTVGFSRVDARGFFGMQ
ncbi:hypothetical protein FA15DRAFT_683893 [Coprinopsis marcescibilis]|uniref:protein-tyrosine-phosphatase n=1 Tax=Coprinopsis marcescibilis TaxID=230819 RepID=A0A5C3LCW7_COPMA|nr:hypothetical protein FA15DRAFT_683893 [Coprinopsis marcescibilis]